MNVSHFRIDERREREWLRLVLSGELDLASAPTLERRLAQLRADQCAIRLDLSKLEFMDSTGLHLLIRELGEARSNGWRLEIGPDVAPVVMRLFRLVQLEGFMLNGNAPGGARVEDADP